MPFTKETLLQLSYRDLQRECQKAGLSAAGKTRALQQRLRSWLMKKPEPPAKRPKRSPADDLICPITLELPLDPVVAEDGRVYERSAIERYFATQGNANNRQVASPVTKETMGKILISSPPIRNHIETLVEREIIVGDLAEKWSRQRTERKKAQDLLNRARGGCVDAMVDVAQNYDFGADGFPQDPRKAFKWYDKARIAGSAIGSACIGETLLKMEEAGSIQTKLLGVMYLTSAAERGSDFAAYWLGMALATGTYGLPQDSKEAQKWLEKAASKECTVIHLMEEDKQKIPEELEKLAGRKID